jgi:hypothetical protein
MCILTRDRSTHPQVARSDPPPAPLSAVMPSSSKPTHCSNPTASSGLASAHAAHHKRRCSSERDV